jgi:hypothetical protein
VYCSQPSNSLIQYLRSISPADEVVPRSHPSFRVIPRGAFNRCQLSTRPTPSLALPSALPRFFLPVACVPTLPVRSIRYFMDDPAQPLFHNAVRHRGTTRARRFRASCTAPVSAYSIGKAARSACSFPAPNTSTREFSTLPAYHLSAHI